MKSNNSIIMPNYIFKCQNNIFDRAQFNCLSAQIILSIFIISIPLKKIIFGAKFCCKPEEVVFIWGAPLLPEDSIGQNKI